MAIIGYARTSTREQEAGLQADYSNTTSIPEAIDIIGMPRIRPDRQMSGNDATLDDIPRPAGRRVALRIRVANSDRRPSLSFLHALPWLQIRAAAAECRAPFRRSSRRYR